VIDNRNNAGNYSATLPDSTVVVVGAGKLVSVPLAWNLGTDQFDYAGGAYDPAGAAAAAQAAAIAASDPSGAAAAAQAAAIAASTPLTAGPPTVGNLAIFAAAGALADGLLNPAYFISQSGSGVTGNVPVYIGAQTIQDSGIPVSPNQTQTTYNGTAGGTAVWSMPWQTATYKKFVINLQGLTDNGGTITFPTPFVNTPAIYGDAVAVAAVASVSTTTLTFVIGTGGATGNVFVEGY